LLPDRSHGTSLKNPDFAADPRSFGAQGELVEITGQSTPALERAPFGGPPALFELRLAAEAITPSTTLSDIRAALKRRRGND
jgi:acetolactate synthase I/II/III large subunit